MTFEIVFPSMKFKASFKYLKERRIMIGKDCEGLRYWYCSICIHKEGWVLKNLCFQIVVLKKTLESPLGSKEIKPVHPKGKQPWIFIGRTDAEAPILWPPDAKSRLIGKKSWCWERLRAGGEGGNRGWDGWMASLTQWTWIWVKSGRQWRTEAPGVLQSMGLQRVGHDLAAE